MDLLIRIIADGLVVLIVFLGGITFLFSVKGDYYQSYIRALMAGLSAFTFAKIMSLFYQTLERPFVTLGVEPKAAYLDNPGFPSDHALFVMTIALIILAVTKYRYIAIILIILAVMVGIGRVIALVHTPQDVLGGFMAAILGVGLWYGYISHKK